MVLKPSEIAPMDAIIFAEVMHEAGVPPGVFNLVNGDGPGVGTALSSHPDIDMISFTGSSRAGVLIAKAAADTIKRVHQELGGKSANILLDDVDFDHAVAKGVTDCFQNSGQSCNAPTRMFVPESANEAAIEIAKRAAESIKVGAPTEPGVQMGPVVSEVQYNKIQGLIQAGIDEGATLVTGGTGRPEGLNRGYYVRPTVFANVTPEMRIAKEEIFGPVISILTYNSEAEVVAEANNTVYGLASYVQSGRSQAGAADGAENAFRQCLYQLPAGRYQRAVRRDISSPAMAANGASGAWRSFWRSKAWWVTKPPEPERF